MTRFSTASVDLRRPGRGGATTALGAELPVFYQPPLRRRALDSAEQIAFLSALGIVGKEGYGHGR
jgi:hypothetical protein